MYYILYILSAGDLRFDQTKRKNPNSELSERREEKDSFAHKFPGKPEWKGYKNDIKMKNLICQ